MSQNHIPGPWTHHEGTGDIYKDGYLIVSVRLNSRDIEPEERATAKRIVETINALEEFDNPLKMIEEYKLLQPILLDLLKIWDRGNSVVASCVYPNAIRLTLGLKPQPPITISICCKVCGSRHQKHYAYCPHC